MRVFRSSFSEDTGRNSIETVMFMAVPHLDHRRLLVQGTEAIWGIPYKYASRYAMRYLGSNFFPRDRLGGGKSQYGGSTISNHPRLHTR